MKMKENSLSEKEAWIALQGVSGIGSVLAHRLVKHFGSARDVWGHSVWDYCAVNRVGTDLAQNLAKGPDMKRVSAILSRTEKLGAWVIHPGSAAYPPRLLEIYDPPVVLYGRGDPDLLQKKGVAIIGSRRASSYGRSVASRLAGGVAAAGLVVISGIAAGIDGVSHQAAMEAGGLTVGVKGCGIDQVYPKHHRGLEEKMVEQGAVVTEYPPGTPPDASHFPERNRIISGLSMAVVVVEAGSRSGSLITARLAAEQGRDVMAVPGTVFSWGSQGPHRLIKQGAALVQDSSEVLEELGVEVGEGFHSHEVERDDLSREEKQVIDNLVEEPQHIDSICAACKMPVQVVSRVLLGLEIKGVVVSFPGSRYGLNTTSSGKEDS